MAEPRSDWSRTERDETVDPRNPPNSVVNSAVRTTALWAYLGPIVGLFVIVAIVLLYWMARDSRPDDETLGSEPVGTAGTVTPGGREPAPHPKNTQEELKRRGNLEQ